MSWSAIIQVPQTDDQGIAVPVIFTNGVSAKEVKVLRPSSTDDLNNQIQARLDALNAKDTLLPTIVPGPFTPLVAATGATAAQTQFANDLDVLEQMTRAINLGIKANTDKDYLAQLATVKSELGATPALIALV